MLDMRSAIPGTGKSRLVASLAGLYAVDAIRALTSRLTPEHITILVSRNASFWYDCIPQDGRDMLKERAASYEDAANSISNDDIHGWVLDARPDFIGILGSPQGQAWLNATIAEIRSELWKM